MLRSGRTYFPESLREQAATMAEHAKEIQAILDRHLTTNESDRKSPNNFDLDKFIWEIERIKHPNILRSCQVISGPTFALADEFRVSYMLCRLPIPRIRPDDLARSKRYEHSDQLRQL